MRQLLLCAAAALALAGCMNKGKAWYQDGDAVAAAQSAGYTDVMVWRPNFTCQVPPALNAPIVPVSNGQGTTSGQDGHFLTAKTRDSRYVRLMICEGMHAPMRIQEIDSTIGEQRDFEPVK